jgi:L-threonylcarbamoyladenylate synthase
MEKLSLKKFSKKSPYTPLPAGRQALSRGLNVIADFLKRGKVIIYPTDTIYGFGCLATSKKAIRKIYKIKKREKGKALLILVNSLAMVKKYCYISKEQEGYLRKVWKPHARSSLLRRGALRPVTVILKSRGFLPKELAGGENSLAVRLPRNEFLIKIIKKVGCPIVSTSANISGQEYSGDLEKINKLFSKEINLLVGAGKLKNKPSRIVDLRDISNIRVIRR